VASTTTTTYKDTVLLTCGQMNYTHKYFFKLPFQKAVKGLMEHSTWAPWPSRTHNAKSSSLSLEYAIFHFGCLLIKPIFGSLHHSI